MLIGTTIGHYEITALLGEGGMGQVYLAKDTRLERDVALKFLPQSLADSPVPRARLMREAKAASRLSHPNIVTVHAVEEVDGRTFIVMEYVPGRPLSSLGSGEELPLDRAIDLIIQIADGLAKAHAAGVVHRDIKPGNIFIDDDGRPRILDFGLAHLAGADKLTKPWTTFGTVMYTTPEQTQGQEADSRSDIFSLGIVFYELLTGQPPFTGDHEAVILYGITNLDPQPLAQHRPDLPAELQNIVTKCLQKDPSQRYQTAADLAADLRALRAGAGTVTRLRVVHRRLWMVTLPVLAVVALATWFFTTAIQREGNALANRPMLAVLPFENLGAAEDEYFADGITEEITTHVAKVSGLGVISRTSCVAYKKTEKTLRQIADELGVSYILEGTTRWDHSRRPPRVRINAQLIRVSDDTHIWADAYDRPIVQILDTQTEIAKAVVNALKVPLLDREEQQLASTALDNSPAYEEYLHGLAYVNRPDFSANDARSAIQRFERAVAIDSTYALAYAALSYAYSRLYLMGVKDRSELLEKAEAALQRALELNPELPEALLAKGVLAYLNQHDDETALSSLKRVTQLRPGSSEALRWMAAVYRRQGEFELALKQLQAARALDPRHARTFHALGCIYTQMRRFDDALQAFKRSTELEPLQVLDFAHSAWVHWLKDGALEAADSALSLVPADASPFTEYTRIRQAVLQRDYQAALQMLEASTYTVFYDQEYYIPLSLYQAHVLVLMGHPWQAAPYLEAARDLLEEELAVNPDDYRLHSSLGIAYAYLGRKDDAMRHARRASDLLPDDKDAISGARLLEDAAYASAILGDAEAAIENLEYLMSVPCNLSVALLKLDQRWEPLHGQPGFQALIQMDDRVF
jgi:serine/threonine protein kinase/tetratricopeptide (TPR) repeat protein